MAGQARADVSAADESRTLLNRGKALLATGQLAEAEAALLRAKSLCPDAVPWVQACLSATESVLGDLRQRQGDLPGAEDFLKQSLIDAELGFPKTDRWIVVRLRQLGVVYDLQRNYAASEASFRRALDIAMVQQPPDPLFVADSLLFLMPILQKEARVDEAVSAGRQAVGILETAGPSSELALMRCLLQLGRVLAANRRNADAESVLKRSIDIAEKIAVRTDLAAALGKLANLYNAQRRFAEAEPLYRRALQLDQSIYGPDSVETSVTAHNLGYFFFQQHRYADARVLVERAITLQENANQPDRATLASSLALSGDIAREQSRYRDAAALIERALTLVDGARDPLSMANTLGHLATLRLRQSDFPAALIANERALHLLEHAGLQDDPEVISIKRNIAEVHAARGASERAAAVFGEAATLAERLYGPDSRELALILHERGLNLRASNQYEPAERDFRRALQLFRATDGDGASTAPIEVNLGLTLERLGRTAEAKAMLDEAIRVAEADVDRSPLSVGRTLQYLGAQRAQAGRYP
jgi:tetratricopeptide (TPR) repeat protein